MPTYEFRCPKGHEFERFYKTMSTAPAEAKCPECGAVAVRQLSGGGGLVFKGSGFYLTDYGKNAHRGLASETKSEGGKAEGGKAEGGKAEGGKTEGGKTESPTSKPEAKSDASKPTGENTRPPEAGNRARSDSAKSSKSPKPKSE
jgi:putative FmdB family regulatory protein